MSESVFRLQILDCFDFKPLQSNSLYILYTYAAITTNYDTTGNEAILHHLSSCRSIYILQAYS